MVICIRYFGLQVVHADKLKGGQSLLIDVNDIVKNLNKQDLKVLRSERIKFKIPSEFSRGGNQVNEGRIISHNKDKFNNLMIRYRRDIIMNRETMDSRMESALKSLESLIQIDKSKLIKYHIMKDNDIFIIDNTRWLHGRTCINDLNRHLVRIRFQSKYKSLFPIY